MRKNRYRLSRIGIFLGCLIAGCLAAFADPSSQVPRIALVTGSDSADFSSLIVTELSQNGEIALLERDALEKVGDEHKLRQMVDADAVALGNLLGAEGLLFLNKTPDGIQTRFTAVGLGYALFDDRFDSKSDLPQLAKSIAHRVVDYAPKLRLRPDQQVPISILNLRADVSGNDGNALERRLTLLLENRLSSIPEYVVLERRHAWDLNFESSLSASPPPLLQGMQIIDGTITPPLNGKDEVIVHLRMRSGNTPSSSVEVRGTTKDLSSIAEAMAAAVRKTSGASPSLAPWQPQKEAREYLLEGLWGYQHDAVQSSLEALDAAALLGETAPDLLAARIAVLCGFATGSPRVYQGDVDVADDPHPEPRIEAALRAIDDFHRYEDGGMESGLQFLKQGQFLGGRTTEFRWMVTRTAGSLTEMLDRTHHPRADEMRAAFRAFAHYPPHLDQPAGGMRSIDLALALDYVDNWADSLEEEKAFYRTFYTAPPEMRGVFSGSRNGLRPDTFGRRFFSDANKEYAAFFALMKEWRDDPATRLTALFALADYSRPPRQEANCRTLYDTLWEARENLAATKQLLFYLTQAFDIESARKLPEADPKLIALLHFALQHAGPGDAMIERIWHPELFPTAEAPALWKDLQDLQTRVAGDRFLPSLVSRMRQSYIDHFGDPQTDATSLKVTRFWLPREEPGTYEFIPYPLHVVSDGVWVAGYKKEEPLEPFLYHVHIDAERPDPFLTEPPIHPPVHPHDMASSPTTLYLLGFSDDHYEKAAVAQLDVVSGHWETHEVPYANRIANLAGRLYLSLSGKGVAFESGIALYDDQTGQTTVLASSRRRPGQNQFDDRDAYNVSGFFSGPGNKSCVSIGFGETYVIGDQPGPWPLLIQSGGLSHVQTDGIRTLLFGPRYGERKGEVVFMVDPSKDAPELWLGSAASLMGTGMTASKEQATPVPPWPQPSLWPEPAAEEKRMGIGGYFGDFGFRGDDLFSFATDPETQHKTLRWYRRGSPDPVSIPLVFENEKATAAMKTDVAHADPRVQKIREAAFSQLRMSLSPQGIFFRVDSLGFWFLPFSDIDAYLKAHPKEKPN